jgi:hypothetical protein
MKIRTEEDLTGFAPKDCKFTAWDDDSWDVAEDSRNRGMVGHRRLASAARGVGALGRG